MISMMTCIESVRPKKTFTHRAKGQADDQFGVASTVQIFVPKIEATVAALADCGQESMKEERDALTNSDPDADLDIQLERSSLLPGLCRSVQPVSIVGRAFAHTARDTVDRASAVVAGRHPILIERGCARCVITHLEGFSSGFGLSLFIGGTATPNTYFEHHAYSRRILSSRWRGSCNP
jgi:hypothetical protein